MSRSALGNWVLARLDKPVLVLELRRQRRSLRLWPYLVFGAGLAVLAFGGGLWWEPRLNAPRVADTELAMLAFALMGGNMLAAVVRGVRAVVAEREKGTLEQLALTPLRSAEIADGKLIALLTEPVLALGGMLPSLVLLAAVGTVSCLVVLPICALIVISTVIVGYLSLAAAVMASSASDATFMLLFSLLGMLFPSSIAVFRGCEIDIVGPDSCEWAVVYPLCWVTLLALFRLARALRGVRQTAWWTQRRELLCGGLIALLLTLVPVTRDWLGVLYNAVWNVAAVCLNPFVSLDALMSPGSSFASATSVTRTWPQHTVTVGGFSALGLAVVLSRGLAIRMLNEERRPSRGDRLSAALREWRSELSGRFTRITRRAVV